MTAALCALRPPYEIHTRAGIQSRSRGIACKNRAKNSSRRVRKLVKHPWDESSQNLTPGKWKRQPRPKEGRKEDDVGSDERDCFLLESPRVRVQRNAHNEGAIRTNVASSRTPRCRLTPIAMNAGRQSATDRRSRERPAVLENSSRSRINL